MTRIVGLTLNPTGRDEIPPSAAIRGSAQELADVLRAWAREGVTHIQVWLLPNTPESSEAFAPPLALLDGS